MDKIVYVVFILVVTIFTGCSSNSPLPFQEKVMEYNISAEKKQLLLDSIINDNRNIYAQNAGCLYIYGNAYNDSYMYGSYNNCFIIKDNILTREDHSSCRYKSTSVDCKYILGKSYKYSEYLSSLQLKLPSLYQTEVEKYEQFILKYNNLLNEANIKLDKTKAVLIDHRKMLPKELLKQLNNSFEKELIYEKDEIKAFKMYESEISSENFQINYALTKNNIDRYLLEYDVNELKNSYNKFQDIINFNVKNISYIFIPDNFIIEDKYLAVEVKNKSNGLYDLNTIKFTNKSKQFIEISSISGYYNNNVENNIILLDNDVETRLKIAPMSSLILNSTDIIFKNFPKEKFISLKSRNQTVKYGFSIEYTVGHKQDTENLYGVKNYTIKSFK